QPQSSSSSVVRAAPTVDSRRIRPPPTPTLFPYTTLFRSLFSRPETPLPRHDLVPVDAFPNDEGLNDPVLLDRLRQLLQGIGIKLFPGLIGIRPEFGDVHLVDDVVFRDIDRGKKRSESFSQPLATHCESLPSPARCNIPLRGSGGRRGESASRGWAPRSAEHCGGSPSCTPCAGSTSSLLPSPGRTDWYGRQTSSRGRPRSPAACSNVSGRCGSC